MASPVIIRLVGEMVRGTGAGGGSGGRKELRDRRRVSIFIRYLLGLMGRLVGGTSGGRSEGQQHWPRPSAGFY